MAEVSLSGVHRGLQPPPVLGEQGAGGGPGPTSSPDMGGQRAGGGDIALACGWVSWNKLVPRWGLGEVWALLPLTA